MKLFEFAGIETEWVAAHDEDEARQLLKRHYGIGDDDIASSYESVSEVDAATVEFYVDGTSAVDEDDDTPTMTAAEMMAGKTKPFVVGSTCGKDSETNECAVCAQWWKDNPPSDSRHLTKDEQGALHRALRKSVKIVRKAKR